MSCTIRMRSPPTSKLCGDSNSSSPMPALARVLRPSGSPSLRPKTPASVMWAFFERLEHERGAEVARVQHHRSRRPPPSDGSIRPPPAPDRVYRPSRQRASRPPVGVVHLVPHEILVRLARGHHGEPVAVHQHLRRPTAGCCRWTPSHSRTRRRRTPPAGRRGRPSSIIRSSARKSPALAHRAHDVQHLLLAPRRLDASRCGDRRCNMTDAAVPSCRRRPSRTPCRRCACGTARA